MAKFAIVSLLLFASTGVRQHQPNPVPTGEEITTQWIPIPITPVLYAGETPLTGYESSAPPVEQQSATTNPASVDTVKPAPTNSVPLKPLRMCESSDNYRINTGNGFHGAYQYLQSTWNAVTKLMGREDLMGVPVEQVSPQDQDDVTVWWWNHSNPHSQWPVCSYKAEAA